MSEDQSQVDDDLDLENEDGDGQEPRKLTYEELEAALAKVRQSEAKTRIKKRDADAETARKLAEHDEWKRSQMTEAERLRVEKQEIENEMKALRRERHQETAARKAKLDPELADRIKGETEEEMLEDAKRLAKKYPATATSANADRLFAGTHGTPVGDGKEQSESDWFRSQFRKN